METKKNGFLKKINIKTIKKMYKKVIYQGVDPAFLLDAFPLDDRTFYLFIYENLIFKKRLGFATYFVLFLNGKQNKKENSKCDFLFGKM